MLWWDAAAKPPMVTTVMEFFQSILKLNQVRSQLEGKVENDYKMGLTTPSIATCINSSVPYAFASSWDKCVLPLYADLPGAAMYSHMACTSILDLLLWQKLYALTVQCTWHLLVRPLRTESL